MPDRAPRGGAFPVDATLRGSRRTRAMRVFRVASSSSGWNLARRGGHRRRRPGRVRARSTPSPVDASARWRAHREPPRRNTRVKCPSGGRIAPRRESRASPRGPDRWWRTPEADGHACWCGPTRSRRLSDDEADEDENDENDENGRDDGSVGESSDAARAVAALVRQLSGEGQFAVVPAPTRLKAAKAKKKIRVRVRVLVPVPVPVPVPVARASSSSPTGCVPSMVAALRRGDGRGGEGRTCRFLSEDGGCHVSALPEDRSRARAHLAAENRAWAARASAAARSEARTEEHAHESLEASASWARTRAGVRRVRVRRRRASVRLSRSSCPWRTGTRTWRGARERRRGGGGGGVVARGRSAQRRRRLRRRRRHVRRHARRRGSRVDHGRSTGGVRAASAAASMAAETAAVAERLGREAARAAGARIVGHVGQFAPSRGLTFREHNAAAWCVAADRETLVTGTRTGTSSRGISARRKSRDSSGGEQDHAREGCVWVGGTRVAKR